MYEYEEARDVDYEEVHKTTTSFDDFLEAIGNPHAIPRSAPQKEVQGPEDEMELLDTFEFKTTKQPVDEDDFASLLEELEVDISEEESFDPDAEEDEGEEDDAEFDENDEAEEEVDAKEQFEDGYDYNLEEWSSSIRLPDGTEVTAQELYNLRNMKETHTEMEQRAFLLEQRETQLNNQNDLSAQAVAMMEQRLIQKAQQGLELSVYDQAQYQVLNQMKHYLGTATEHIRTSQQKQQIMAEQAIEAQLNYNVDVLFDRYPNIVQDLSDIRVYLKDKGIKDPDAYFKSVRMDPAVIEVLQDALLVNKMRQKVGSVKRVPKAVKTSRQKTTIKRDDSGMVTLPEGVSSYDAASYKQFVKIMNG